MDSINFLMVGDSIKRWLMNKMNVHRFWWKLEFEIKPCHDIWGSDVCSAFNFKSSFAKVFPKRVDMASRGVFCLPPVVFASCFEAPVFLMRKETQGLWTAYLVV
mgnify:CR=1 FL=1